MLLRLTIGVGRSVGPLQPARILTSRIKRIRLSLYIMCITWEAKERKCKRARSGASRWTRFRRCARGFLVHHSYRVVRAYRTLENVLEVDLGEDLTFSTHGSVDDPMPIGFKSLPSIGVGEFGSMQVG